MQLVTYIRPAYNPIYAIQLYLRFTQNAAKECKPKPDWNTKATEWETSFIQLLSQHNMRLMS